MEKARSLTESADWGLFQRGDERRRAGVPAAVWPVVVFGQVRGTGPVSGLIYPAEVSTPISVFPLLDSAEVNPSLLISEVKYSVFHAQYVGETQSFYISRPNALSVLCEASSCRRHENQVGTGVTLGGNSDGAGFNL